MQNRYQKVMSFFGQVLNNSSERSEQSAVIVLDCLLNIEVSFPPLMLLYPILKTSYNAFKDPHKIHIIVKYKGKL